MHSLTLKSELAAFRQFVGNSENNPAHRRSELCVFVPLKRGLRNNHPVGTTLPNRVNPTTITQPASLS
jgi:hypothetical protein